MDIKKEDIEHLSVLSRIDLEGKEDELLKDADAILGYFEELKQVNTDDIAPMAGATDMTNRSEADEVDEELKGKGIESFPEAEQGYLKVPGVRKKD
jgi:aspartyl-tRNA(Asn)/glutamyl-tRNA(Gln) amidotransferase subunit C